jgi:autonomous glycyl radical cofactor GrcA
MFNNYSLTLNSKWIIIKKKGFTKKAILIKQGFTNFEYVVVDDKGAIDKKNAVDGNFTKPKMIILF